MIRLWSGPATVVVPDIRRKLPGRGVWVTGTLTRVPRPSSAGPSPEGSRRRSTSSDDLAAEIDGSLTRIVCSRCRIANKAGQVITGFTKVERAHRRAALLPVLCMRRRWRRRWDAQARASLHRRATAMNEPPVHEPLSVDQLDLALGRQM